MEVQWKITICFLAVILSIVIANYIDNAKTKARKKAWYAGRKDIADSLKSATFWIKDNPQLTNFLWIVANDIVEFDHFNIDKVRNNINKLGSTKIHDLPIDTVKEYLSKNNFKPLKK